MGTDHGAEASAEHGIPRSPQWPSARKRHLSTQPYCLACKMPSRMGKIIHKVATLTGIKAMQVHHKIPFHFCVLLGRPDLEFDQRNLITLCSSGKNHHLFLGHLDDFKAYNPNVVNSVIKYFNWTGDQIRKDPDWMTTSKGRPKAWDKMTDDDKKDLRALMDRLYPLAAPGTPQ
jgi:hypothetical protein